MPDSNELNPLSREFIIQRAAELSDDVVRDIARLVLPPVEIMPKLAEAFGVESMIYGDAEELFAGVRPFGMQSDVEHFREWLQRWEFLFWERPALFREADPEFDEGYDDDDLL